MSDWQSAPPPGGFPPPTGSGGALPQWGAPVPSPQNGKVKVGELLQASFQTIRENLSTFLIVAFMASFPGTVIGQFFSHRLQTAVTQAQMEMMNSLNGPQANAPFEAIKSMFSPMNIGGLCFSIILNFVLLYLAQAILMHVTIENAVGRKPLIGEAISRGLRRGFSVLVAGLLITLAMIAAVFPGAFLFGILAVGAGAAGEGAVIAAMCCGLPLGSRRFVFLLSISLFFSF